MVTFEAPALWDEIAAIGDVRSDSVKRVAAAVVRVVWSSTSKPPRRSASLFRSRRSAAPTGCSVVKHDYACRHGDRPRAARPANYHRPRRVPQPPANARSASRHSEMTANLLIGLGANFRNFSECPLINHANHRFESWRPSQPVRCRCRSFQVCENSRYCTILQAAACAYQCGGG